MGKWFRGVFAGSLLGFVAGIFLAPQKGEKTREQVGQMTADLNERVKQFGDSAKATYSTISDKAKSTFGGNNKAE